MTELRRDILKGFVARLNDAGHGQKGAIFNECAAYFGWSRQKAIRLLKEVGYETKRKVRSDKGKTTVSEDTLLRLAAVQRSGSTKNGKDALHVTGAYSIVKTEGYDLNVSVARARALLRERQLDRKSLSRPTPHVQMRSLHPNHVHLVDPSLSRLYYSPQGLSRIRDAEANRNKVQGFKKLKLWRYVLTDHYSGSVVMKYYESAGENQTNLYDFLLYAWGVKNNPIYHFHGMPDILLMDSGSANISRAMTYALKALDIKTIAHGVEKPRVKGQVEKYNDVAEPFETRLRLQPQMTVEAINAAAEKWCANYNADCIRNYNAKLNRNGFEIVRLESWLTIKPEQLRELPPKQVCHKLLTREPKRVVVRGDLMLPFEGRIYPLAGLPGLYVGMEVFVQPLLMRDDDMVRVHYMDDQREEVSIEVAPVAIDEHSGFLDDAPVLGQEYKAHKKTILEKNAEKLDELVGNQKRPFNGEIAAISQLDDPDIDKVYIARKGEQSIVAGGYLYDAKLTPVQIAQRLRKSLGFWSADCMNFIQNNYPNGAKESELKSIETHLKGAHDGNSYSKTSVA